MGIGAVGVGADAGGLVKAVFVEEELVATESVAVGTGGAGVMRAGSWARTGSWVAIGSPAEEIGSWARTGFRAGIGSRMGAAAWVAIPGGTSVNS